MLRGLWRCPGLHGAKKAIDGMTDSHHNIRNTKPIKIDLSPEEALRRAMHAPPPPDEPVRKKKATKAKPAKAKKRPSR